MKLPKTIGPIHFIGIGGIGMSGIAEVMHNLGYQVQGSDLSANANVARLRKLGVNVMEGHGADNLGEAQVVVISSAVKPDNPEVMMAREKFLPVVRRAEMLAELMRFKSSIAIGGTHGKTTTTSMVATVLDAAGFDPTVINGGIINAYGTNARLGAGDWLVAEADESDGTFVKLPAEIAIVTNIDPEHLDHYGDFETEKAAFRTFVENVPFYGFAIMCIDHPEVQTLIGMISDRRIVTYGTSPQADVQLTELRHEGGMSRFNVVFRDRAGDETRTIAGLSLAMPGEHNALNALAAIALAHELGIEDDIIKSALSAFGGVKRRFTRTGIWHGALIYDDYAHHPVEIAAALKAARASASGRVIAVMQPHRYSRLRDLFDQFCACFNDADTVIVSPVYEAGESLIEGFDRDGLADGLRARGHRDVQVIDGPQDLAPMLGEMLEEGDLVIFMGAGSITLWANALPQELEEMGSKSAAS